MEIKTLLNLADTFFQSEGTFLIGSHARGDTNLLSDIDILVITDSSKKIDDFKALIPGTFNSELVSIIKYPKTRFEEHWKSGSLFSYHLVNESLPFRLNDSIRNWMQKNHFVLKNNFLEDLNQQLEKISAFENPEVFVESTIYFSSELFLILKNSAMFAIAQEGKPVLNKFHVIFWLKERYRHNPLIEVHLRLLLNSYLHIYKNQPIESNDYGLQTFTELLNSVKGIIVDEQGRI